MRTLLLYAMIIWSSALSAQTVPDFNTKIMREPAADIKQTKNAATYDQRQFMVPVPSRLKNDMELLMGITGNHLDARGAFQYNEKSKRRIDSLTMSRDCTRIFGDPDKPEKCDRISFVSSASFNDKMMAYNDSIKRYQMLREFFKTANVLGGAPTFWRGFHPIRSTTQAKYFFLDNTDEENIMFINKVGLQSNFSSIYNANATLLTGVIPTWKIPLKFSMATNITQQTSERDSIAATKLPNGGLLNVGVLWPAFFKQWYVDNGKKVAFYLPIEYRYNIDDVKDNVAFNDTYYYHELSAYLMGTVDLLQKDDVVDVAALFGAFKMSYYNGGNQFSSRLSANKFWTAYATLGVQIKNKYTVSANIPLWSDNDLIKQQQVATLGLTFQPSKKE
ncbi:MAG: hypothetical protein K0M56_07625 [Kaistella sp.]|nr:hypothetical protein [Kaistella sp.]